MLKLKCSENHATLDEASSVLAFSTVHTLTHCLTGFSEITQKAEPTFKKLIRTPLKKLGFSSFTRSCLLLGKWGLLETLNGVNQSTEW